MQLTRILCFYKNRMKVPGNLYSGKHRLYKKITVKDKKAALAQLMLEQENLNALSNPYLTVEEDHSHMRDIGRHNLTFQAMLENQGKKMLPHCTIEDHLAHVNTARRWD